MKETRVVLGIYYLDSRMVWLLFVCLAECWVRTVWCRGAVRWYGGAGQWYDAWYGGAVQWYDAWYGGAVQWYDALCNGRCWAACTVGHVGSHKMKNCQQIGTGFLDISMCKFVWFVMMIHQNCGRVKYISWFLVKGPIFFLQPSHLATAFPLISK